MLTLEIVGVLGALFGFLAYCMVRAQLAGRQAEVEREAEESAAAASEGAR